MKRISKLLRSPNSEDLEIGLILLEKKRKLLTSLYNLEWILSFPLFLITFASFAVNVGDSKAKKVSIRELNLLFVRRDIEYIGNYMFWSTNYFGKSIDLVMSPIGYIYLRFKRKKK